MADPNFAIVVGIARYRDPVIYVDLEGPPNDVERMVEWLTATNGGDVLPKNAHVLLTPPNLLNGQAPPAVAPGVPLTWSPDKSQFANTFYSIVLDNDGQYIRRNSRLYLYFSGHGFSEYDEDVPRAALFAADAFGLATPNLPGSVYAEAVKRVSLFKEVVLIMDCCRDELANSKYGSYELDRTPGGGEQNVKLNALYAVPKRGKAQEREITGTNGKVYGLLTHALVKSLDEGPTDVVGRIWMSQLVNYMTMHWQEWHPEQPPPPPRLSRYDSEDVFFNSRKTLIPQKFTVPSPLTEEMRVSLWSDSSQAQGVVTNDKVLWRDPKAWTVEVPFDESPIPGRQAFTLKLPGESHTVCVIRADAPSQTFQPEANHAINL